jgi:hypothetical protein
VEAWEPHQHEEAIPVWPRLGQRAVVHAARLISKEGDDHHPTPKAPAPGCKPVKPKRQRLTSLVGCGSQLWRRDRTQGLAFKRQRKPGSLC